MISICEEAIARGSDGIAFTDHLDFGPDDTLGYFRPVEYLAEIERCLTLYGSRLTILVGIENRYAFQYST